MLANTNFKKEYIFYKSYIDIWKKIAVESKKILKKFFNQKFSEQYIQRIDQKILQGLINHFRIPTEKEKSFFNKMLAIKPLWSMEEKTNRHNFALVKKICIFAYSKINNIVLNEGDPFEKVASNFIRVAPSRALERICPNLLLKVPKNTDPNLKLLEAVLYELAQRNDRNDLLYKSNLMLFKQLQEKNEWKSRDDFELPSKAYKHNIKTSASIEKLMDKDKELIEIQKKLGKYQRVKGHASTKAIYSSNNKKPKKIKNKIRD